MHFDFQNSMPVIDRDTIRYDPKKKRLSFDWIWDAPVQCGINIVLSTPNTSQVDHKTEVSKGTYTAYIDNLGVDDEGFWIGELSIRAYIGTCLRGRTDSDTEYSTSIWSKSDTVTSRGMSLTPKFINESDNEFVDISSEAHRTYNFGQKGFVKINKPLMLSISSSGGHRIFSADGQSHYIPTGWLNLSWSAKDGSPHFVK